MNVTVREWFRMDRACRDRAGVVPGLGAVALEHLSKAIDHRERLVRMSGREEFSLPFAKHLIANAMGDGAGMQAATAMQERLREALAERNLAVKELRVATMMAEYTLGIILGVKAEARAQLLADSALLKVRFDYGLQDVESRHQMLARLLNLDGLVD